MNDLVHHAIPVPPEARTAQYKANRTQYHLVETLRRQQGRFGLLYGSVAYVAAGCMALGLFFDLSRPPPEPRLVVLNQQDGSIGPARALSDAPKYYTSTMVEGEVHDYIDRRESYIPQLDKVYWTKVMIMSSALVFGPYDTFVNSREGPKREYGVDGAITIDNIQMLGDALKSENGTYSYQFRFDRHKAKGASVFPVETCTGSISLQFHPDIKLFSPDRINNRMGTEVVAYEVLPCKLKDVK